MIHQQGTSLNYVAVVRAMFKYLPISIEVQTQAQHDEVVRKDITAEPEFIEAEETEEQVEVIEQTN